MKTLIKAYNTLLALTITILGFSCSNDQPDEYGTPSADFIIMGKITSENNEAIKDIQVLVPHLDTVISDNNGNYIVVAKTVPESPTTLRLEFKDIDNALNGEFQDTVTSITFENPKFTGGDGHWYKGETTMESNIKLKPKNGSK